MKNQSQVPESSCVTPTTETPQRFYPLRDPDDPARTTLVPVSEDFHQTIGTEISRIRKREQRAGRCFCPKRLLWTCDAACDVCPYHNEGGDLSLDEEVSEEGGVTLGDFIPGTSPDTDTLLMDAELLCALCNEVDRLDPDGQEICRAVSAGLSDRSAAKETGMPRNTYTYRKGKALDRLRQKLEEYP